MNVPTGHDNLGSGSFNTTNWSVVFTAGQRGSTDAQAALALLCGTYWYPLFSFARRCGHDAAQAEDLTQGFFESLLEKDFLHEVDRNHGRFRSFLLAAFKHYASKQQRAARAQKRGGSRRIFSMELADAEGRYVQEPYHEKTAEQLFEHQWALTLLDNVLTTLRNEHQASGKADYYDGLKCFLGGSGESSYRDVAQRLATSEGAVKTAVHRLRRRLGELLRQEIARTVGNPDEIEDEVCSLFASLQI